jgi:hypothetical protein
LKGPQPAGGTPNDFDVWQFRRGELARPGCPLVAEVAQSGSPLDWTFASQGTPILSEAAVASITSVPGLKAQFIPIAIREVEGAFVVMNVLDVVDAVDEDRSVGVRFPDDHRRRPGEWRRMTRLVLRDAAVKSHVLFYLATWRPILCASSDVVEALTNSQITGIDPAPLETSAGP